MHRNRTHSRMKLEREWRGVVETLLVDETQAMLGTPATGMFLLLCDCGKFVQAIAGTVFDHKVRSMTDIGRKAFGRKATGARLALRFNRAYISPPKQWQVAYRAAAVGALVSQGAEMAAVANMLGVDIQTVYRAIRNGEERLGSVASVPDMLEEFRSGSLADAFNRYVRSLFVSNAPKNFIAAQLT